MTHFDAKNPKFSYTSRTVERAERSLVCSPFQLTLFEMMSSTSVPVQAIAGNSGVEHNYTKRPVSELAAENALVWLIQVGLLRREVDGQGITDSFRLTPLGRQIVEQYQGSSLRNPSWRDRFYNALNRWFRLPF
ncbi:MAG: hypothetical protein KME05_03880 [Gloeocapsa sp. UFS-A4-WI-NPMV-4B04]|jgi:hypothetical protein|nr:hypothetical protein [Gloeocapsa sp. UFS-A4-WI-NPMV-4B04]